MQLLEPTGVPLEVAVAQFAEAHAILQGRSLVDAARDYARRHRLDLPAVLVADAVAPSLPTGPKQAPRSVTSWTCVRASCTASPPATR